VSSAPAPARDTGAAPPEPAGAPPDRRHAATVVLRLGRGEFGVPIDVVREVLRTPQITPVPFAPAAVIGATAIRGSILPVVDLGLLLAQGPAQRPGSLLVVGGGAAVEPIGLLVDAVTGLLPADAAEPRPPPAEADATLPQGWIAAMLEPEAGRLIALLDPRSVLLAVAPSAGTGDADRPNQTRTTS
jgi:purine-binding chemotaxis protein CheW